MANIQRTCEQCGQTDDHPRISVYRGTQGWDEVHHDCLPFKEREAIAAENPTLRRIIEAAENGVHGDELRAHIINLHEENV